ncbi:hypothetical protein DWG14_02349 [Streptomyces griseorubiginosus]|uniref:Uncharacterized protein n=1 Tax=Streptomyces griseorubiginosus TaxID=67304 RepID=A0AAI8KYP4_9ACTN|nr:hypothetical protein DWG14_02349 [Streptomyces griseorubiginosus]
MEHTSRHHRQDMSGLRLTASRVAVQGAPRLVARARPVVEWLAVVASVAEAASLVVPWAAGPLEPVPLAPVWRVVQARVLLVWRVALVPEALAA